LARACDKTSVQLRTGESVDNFNLRLSVEQLPPLDSVLPLLQQLAWVDLSAKAKATKPRPGDGAIFGLPPELKLKWKPGVTAKSHKVYFGTESGELSLLAEVEAPSDVKSPPLEEGLTYYWRVDEVWADGTVVTGDIWNFTVGELVGWWKLDETSGETASDSSSNGNVGTLQGDVVWQPNAGKIAGALKFDGTSSYVEIPTAGMSASKGTVALWAKLSPEQAEPEHRYIFGHTTIPPYSNRIQLYMDESATMLDLGLGNSHETNTDMINLEVETWYQVALTWDEGTYVVYLNGEELATDSYTDLESLNSIADIGNNGRPDRRDQSFNGLIDDVHIYNYALSHDEIVALYQGR